MAAKARDPAAERPRGSLVQWTLREKSSLPANCFLIPIAPSKSHQERNNVKLDEPKYTIWNVEEAEGGK